MREIDGIERLIETLAPHWNDIEAHFNEQNEKFLRMVRADHDAIGRVLRAHVLIETFLEEFLTSYYRIDNLPEARLSFHQKAALLPARRSSAAFVRPGILQLNSVRNKFGHRINHVVEMNELSSIYEVLAVARRGFEPHSPIEAIEAFTPIACAFLTVPPAHLQEVFMQAFSELHSSMPAALEAS